MTDGSKASRACQRMRNVLIGKRLTEGGLRVAVLVAVSVVLTVDSGVVIAAVLVGSVGLVIVTALQTVAESVVALSK